VDKKVNTSEEVKKEELSEITEERQVYLKQLQMRHLFSNLSSTGKELLKAVVDGEVDCALVSLLGEMVRVNVSAEGDGCYFTVEFISTGRGMRRVFKDSVAIKEAFAWLDEPTIEPH